MRRLLPASLLLVLLAPSAALAADGERTPLNLRDAGSEAAGPAAAAGGGGGGALIRTIVGLIVVIAVIYGVAWVLRQVKASKEAGPAGGGLETLATLPLGSDRAVHLIRAGDEVVLVGSGSDGVRHLRTYTPEEVGRLGLVADEGDPDAARRTPSGRLDDLRARTVRR